MKKTVIALSVLCASLLATKYTRPVMREAAPKIALVGIVAGMKRKGIWDNATAEMKAFAEAQDEALKNVVELGTLDEKLKEISEKADKGALTTEEKAEFKDVMAGYKSMAQKLQKLEDAGMKGGNIDVVRKTLEENADKIKQFRQKSIKGLTLEIKATQEPTDIDSHTIGFRVPGIGQLPVRQPFLFDIFRVVPTNMEYVKYIDQESVVRDAKNVAGIATSTHNTKLTWKERSIQITKVRDFIHMSQDMLEDYDFVQAEINNLVNSSIVLKVDDNLLNNDGVNPNMHSITEYASEFDATNTIGGTITAWAGKVQNPNIFDLVIAMASQIIALGKDSAYMPDTILMNTVDKYRNMLVKDKNDNYLLPPFVVVVNNKELTIDGMRVRSNPNVPANSIYMFDSTKGTIYMRKGLVMEMSYENRDNFEHEVVTLKGYLRMNFLVRNVDQNAFMKCSDVTAGIAALGGA